MAISAALSQLTPKAIGWLTDDILVQEQIEFFKVIPLFAADPVYVVMQLLEWSLFGEMRRQPVGPKVDKCR